MNDATPAIAWFEEEGALVRIRLSRPKANIIDSAMMQALELHFAKCTANPGVKAVILDAEGDHFSFGASVDEHMPEQCGDMLANFHKLLKKMHLMLKERNKKMHLVMHYKIIMIDKMLQIRQDKMHWIKLIMRKIHMINSCINLANNWKNLNEKVRRLRG